MRHFCHSSVVQKFSLHVNGGVDKVNMKQRCLIWPFGAILCIGIFWEFWKSSVEIWGFGQLFLEVWSLTSPHVTCVFIRVLNEFLFFSAFFPAYAVGEGFQIPKFVSTLQIKRNKREQDKRTKRILNSRSISPILPPFRANSSSSSPSSPH